MTNPLVPGTDETLASGWGAVPVDPVAATPAATPAEVATATQATQAANEIQRATVAATQLTPPPFGVDIVPGFKVSPTWISWITKLYRRVGSADALTPDELSLLDAFSGGSGTLGQEAPWAQGGADPFPDMAARQDEAQAHLMEIFTPSPGQLRGIIESLYLLLEPGHAAPERVVWNDWNLVRDFTPLADAGVPPRTPFQGNIVKDQFGVNDAIQWQSVEALHDWKEGTDFEAHVHWALGGANDATVRGVKWEIEWTACNPVEGGVGPTAFPATTTQSLEFSIPAAQPDRTHRVGTIFNIPAGTLRVGAHLLVRLKRIAAAGTAPAADPFLISFGIHYQSDTRGSRSTFSK